VRKGAAGAHIKSTTLSRAAPVQSYPFLPLNDACTSIFAPLRARGRRWESTWSGMGGDRMGREGTATGLEKGRGGEASVWRKYMADEADQADQAGLEEMGMGLSVIRV
jgi:hypothetical protein